MFNFTFPILILKPWIKEERWSFVWNIFFLLQIKIVLQVTERTC